MSEFKFLPYAAKSRDYPPPVLALLPNISAATWDADNGQEIPSAFLSGCEFFAYGRYALAEALRRSGACPGRAVLLPSFHCRTMVDAALHLGTDIRFYRVDGNLQPNRVHLAALAEQDGVCALVLPHYFGFANDLAYSAAICKANDIDLIEDCAHALYGESGGRILGVTGRYAVASAWKFLPVPEGALLRDNAGPHTASLRTPPLIGEIKVAARVFEQWRHRHKVRNTLPRMDIAELIRHAREMAAIQASTPAGEGTISTFRPELAGMGGARVARSLVSSVSHRHVFYRRRQCYLRWLDGVRGLENVFPLHDSLPEGVVPYTFPLLGDADGVLFHALRLAGIPIWRWEDMAACAVDNCAVTREYRLRLLQLPCHQELSDTDVDWMIAMTRAVSSEMYK